MRGQADVNVSENMSDPYYCIQSFVAFKLRRKCFKKFNFCSTYNCMKELESRKCFKYASFRAKIFSSSHHWVMFTAMHGTVDDTNFCDG